MESLVTRFIVLSIGLVIVVSFNIRVLRHPDFVDQPLTGWWGQVSKVAPGDKPKRLQAYRRMARWNFALILVLAVAWIGDLWRLLQMFLGS